MRKLDIQAIEDIAVGAAILGAGGGGDPNHGKLIAIRAIQKHGAVELLTTEEVPDDALIIPLASMGAPTVGLEKLPKGDEALHACRVLEKHLGKKAYATMPIEAGGMNSTIPISVAATIGIPLIDADGMGRAFPEIPMVTPTIYGVSATPMAMADEKGNTILLHAIDNSWAERFSRAITVEMGGSAFIALYPMIGKEMRKVAVKGSVTYAETIGRTLREAQVTKVNPVEKLLEVTGGFGLFRGKVADVQRRTVKGFARGEAVVDGIENYKEQKLTIQFQNENLVTILGEDVIASVPDLITVVDAELGFPITTEHLGYGARVIVIGMPCNELWRTPKGLELVGPRYFGYDIDYRPIEDRIKEVRA